MQRAEEVELGEDPDRDPTAVAQTHTTR
jgi:hypothetical protein